MVHSNVVIDHIANITSHRDRELLDFSLLKSVKSMLSAPKVMTLHLDNNGALSPHLTFEHNNLHKAESNLEVDSEISERISFMKVSGQEEASLETSVGDIYIRQFEYRVDAEQYLVIYLNKRLDKAQTFLLRGMFEIYRNYLSLLKDSQTDELTGLANRKTFDVAINKVFEMPMAVSAKVDHDRRVNDVASGNPITAEIWIALIDIDNFKTINDTLGHLYGDEILIHLAQIIRASFRQQDLQFRFGGEEFVIILHAASKQKCFEVLERFRKIVEAYSFPKVAKVTVSIGAVQAQKDIFKATLLDRADQAMYHSKREGKNRVTFYEDLVAEGIINESQIESGEVDLF